MSTKAKQPAPDPKAKQTAPDPKAKQPAPAQQSSSDVEDYSNEMIFQPETNSYSLVLRWKPLSHLEMIGLAVHLSIKDRIVDTLDVDYCNFDARGMIGLANVLRNNNTITSISIGHNKLGPIGAQRISVALKLLV
ncbi:MAG: hypothetical protein EZS28_046488 [Streblomastix strix]|uniref:Uncharacterized protein n=1 Tax=Streblomastix strix TaxID=222440 RepID=A0A5J4TKH0_9EUKA|nr:MAG: hypothetical protein EZS28_046488 [Streblomastix strix]